MPPGEQEGRAGPLAMCAVSATGVEAPDGTEPLQWLPLTTGRPEPGGTDAVHAATVLDRYRKRWTLQTWFRTPRSGTRIRDRRPGAADLTMLARERPETPATEVCPEGDIDLLHTLLEAQGHRGVERMEGGSVPAVRDFVIGPGRLVGAHLTKRQPLPGARKVWMAPGGSTGPSSCATPSARERE